MFGALAAIVGWELEFAPGRNIKTFYITVMRFWSYAWYCPKYAGQDKEILVSNSFGCDDCFEYFGLARSSWSFVKRNWKGAISARKELRKIPRPQWKGGKPVEMFWVWKRRLWEYVIQLCNKLKSSLLFEGRTFLFMCENWVRSSVSLDGDAS